MELHLSRIVTPPFAMRPGLARLADGAVVLTPLDAMSTLAAERRSVWSAGESRHLAAGFDPTPAIESIALEAHNTWVISGFDSKTPLETAFEEDFAVLDGETGTVPWLCVCNPSHWAPEDKVGLPLAAIHAPVADNTALLAATAPLVRLVTGGGRWERWVWTLTPSPRFDQHPRRHRREPWPADVDAEALAKRTWFRAERQTFFPVGAHTRQAVFTIRVMLEPLTRVARDAPDAARLAEALVTMSDAAARYKGLDAVKAPIAAWLRRRADAAIA